MKSKPATVKDVIAIRRRIERKLKQSEERCKVRNNLENDCVAFVCYLKSSLIPALKESGRIDTAKDFERAASYINRLINS